MTCKEVVDYFAKFKRVREVSIKEDMATPGEVLITIRSWLPIFKKELVEFVATKMPVQARVVIVNDWVVCGWRVWTRMFEP